MEYEFAPLEGITDAVYRRVHRKYYPGIIRYYTPFISPTQNHRFTARQLRELSPAGNSGVPLVPQLLGKNAADFLWAAEELHWMGYEEVNLNLGCPSGTVTAKGKGAGFLARPDELDRFLEEIFASSPVRVSIKTRLGVSEPSEFEKLLSIFNRYPICRLIVHARTKNEMYRPGVHLDAFAAALRRAKPPLCYNGDIFTPEDSRNFERRFPSVPSVMLGRGLVADPGLVSKLRGEAPNKETLRNFHDELCALYPVVFGSRSAAAHRMKAIWHYMLSSFQGGDAFGKKLIKAAKWQDFLAVSDEIFQTLELLPCAADIGI